MIKYNIRIFAFAILGLAFGTYIILFIATQNFDKIDFHKAFAHISSTISINIILWLLFIKWGWKCKLFYPWLVPFPDLSGNWVGFIKSNWKGKVLEPIPTEVHIHQTFFNIQIRIKTGESKSHSISASFDIDKERGLQRLSYSYLNTPKPEVRERSEIHYGTTLLNFEEFKVEKMDGEYWTSRETTGEINLEKFTIKN